MRVVQSKAECYIRCQCGLEIAYTPHEENRIQGCPKCKVRLIPSNKMLMSTVQEIEIDESRTLPSDLQ